MPVRSCTRPNSSALGHVSEPLVLSAASHRFGYLKSSPAPSPRTRHGRAGCTRLAGLSGVRPDGDP
jgi:hypothetical protein